MKHVMSPPEDVLEDGDYCCDEWLPYDTSTVKVLYHVGTCDYCRDAFEARRTEQLSGVVSEG